MKLKSNQNINDILEELCQYRFEHFAQLFNLVKEYEQDNNININLEIFKDLYFECHPETHNVESLGRNQAECLYMLYNWYKYRVIYNVTNPDLSISKYNNCVSTQLEDTRFFPCYFILYDYTNTPYFGTFVLIEETKALFGLLLIKKKKLGMESIVLTLSTTEIPVENAYADYASRFDLQIEDIIMLEAVAQMLPAVKTTIQIIRAINQGYQNLFNNNEVPPYNEILPIRTYYKKIVKADVRIRKSQVIKVENNQFEFKKKHRFKVFYPKGTLKSPHVRREHWRHIEDKRSQTGYRLVKVRATIVNKDKYDGITEKIVT